MAVDHEKKAALLTRLHTLRAGGGLTADHVRLAADGLGVTERAVWRWLGGDGPGPRRSFELSAADREAFAYYGGNVASVHRTRCAVLAGKGEAAGVPVPEFLAEGWCGAKDIAERTLYRAFETELTPAERAAWRVGGPGAGMRRCT